MLWWFRVRVRSFGREVIIGECGWGYQVIQGGCVVVVRNATRAAHAPPLSSVLRVVVPPDVWVDPLPDVWVVVPPGGSCWRFGVGLLPASWLVFLFVRVGFVSKPSVCGSKRAGGTFARFSSETMAGGVEPLGGFLLRGTASNGLWFVVVSRFSSST